MAIVCKKCGHKGTRADFRLLGHVDSAGGNTYRHCPKCEAAVVCDEVEIIDDDSEGEVWGAGPLRGRVFTRKPKEP
jgi:hypothetical protein